MLEDKKLYIDRTDEDNPIGITLQEIALCIGDYRVDAMGNYDMSIFCTPRSDGYTRINTWAKYKPVRHPSRSVLTDLDREDVDFGLDVSQAHDSTYEGLLNKAIESGCRFGYLLPRGVDDEFEEPFRIDDFDGYNHNAEAPYKYTFYHQKGSANGWMDAYPSPNADLKLTDITPGLLPSDEMQACNLVILYRSESQQYGGGIIFPKNKDGEYITLYDIENSESAPVARFTLPSAGKYNIVAAITDATEDNTEDMFWLFLPNAIFNTEYRPSYTGFTWTYAEDNATVGKDLNGRIVTNIYTDVESLYFTFLFDCTEMPYITGRLIVEIGEWDGTELNDNQEYRYDDVLSSGEQSWIEKSIGGISQLFGNPTIDNIYIRARLEYKTLPAQELYKTIYFDFLTGEQIARLQDPVSLKAIMDAMQW